MHPCPPLATYAPGQMPPITIPRRFAGDEIIDVCVYITDGVPGERSSVDVVRVASNGTQLRRLHGLFPQVSDGASRQLVGRAAPTRRTLPAAGLREDRSHHSILRRRHHHRPRHHCCRHLPATPPRTTS